MIFLTIYVISLIISALIFTWNIYEDGCTLAQLLTMIFYTLIPILNTMIPFVVIFWLIFYKIRDKLETKIVKPKYQRNKNANSQD